jgi:hypothetical protein
MSYWEDIFETYKEAHKTPQLSGASQPKDNKKPRVMFIQIAVPMDNDTQLPSSEALQKIFEKLLESHDQKNPESPIADL